jgi:hypothetical protein
MSSKFVYTLLSVGISREQAPGARVRVQTRIVLTTSADLKASYLVALLVLYYRDFFLCFSNASGLRMGA